MIKPFSKMTIDVLWNDPYISKKMLEYHLNLDSDISSRNINTITKTVNFLISKLNLNKNSHLCDFGCGPGLYTNLFQKCGIKVTGVDFSTNSIEYAKKQNPLVRYVNSNYLNVELNEQYDVITLIYCDFSPLDPSSVNALLTNVYNHLKFKGFFFFDVHNHFLYNQIEESKTSHNEMDGLFMKGEAHIQTTIIKYETQKIFLNHIFAKGDREIELFNWIKCYTKDEITDILHQHGFDIIEMYDTTYGETKAKNDYFAILCQKNNKS